MTQTEAFESALWLAITAPDDDKLQRALNLAAEIGHDLTDEQIDKVKTSIEFRLAERGEYEH
jgi:hypothetical protein